ncbi:MAG TPA: hypothetical protein VGO47_13735 [Chlamydiales bacterium]|nr:hypothetical protein [Chlamydiales bacterium]
MTENFGPELVFSQHVETAEFACQTDPEPLPEPRIEYVPAPVPVPVQTHDIAIQAQEEIPRIAYSDADLQVGSLHSYKSAAIDAPIALTKEIDVQTLPVPIPVTKMQTDTGVLAGTIPIIISNVSAGVTRRGTIVNGSSAGGRLHAIEGDDEGEATEADTGTETEGEYTDAHEFHTPTPMTSSVSDFYSTHSGPRSNADIQSVRTGAQSVFSSAVRSVPHCGTQVSSLTTRISKQ